MSAPKYWDELKELEKSLPNQESDLRLSITSPIGLSTLWVLVEGDADPYFYERMFDMSRTKVLKVGKKGTDGKMHGGNKVVKEFVANLLALGLTQLIIGIIDRDWRPFKKDANQSLPLHIFETDQRDLEMTLLSFSSLRSALEREITGTMNPNHKKWFKKGYWYRKNGQWYRDVWEQCCQVSRYMGGLRIVSSHYALPRVNFTTPDCWDERQHKVYDHWESNLFRSAVVQTGCSSVRMLYYCWIVKYRYGLNHRTIYDVCRGHDFLSVLSEMLIDKMHYSEKWMTFFLAKEMTTQDIKSMRLYQDIERYRLRLCEADVKQDVGTPVMGNV